MASLDDLVTIQKNGVVAVNALVQSLDAFKTLYQNSIGTDTVNGIVNSTLVTTGSGRIINVSVIHGATGGQIYDCASVNEANDANAIYTIPKDTGMYPVNFPFLKGLVVIPVSNETISVSFSKD